MSLFLCRRALLETKIFCRVWEQLQESDLPPPQEDMAKWEAQFNQMMTSQREDLDFDYGGMMQNAWESMGDSFETEPPVQFDDQGLPILGNYVFGAPIHFLETLLRRYSTHTIPQKKTTSTLIPHTRDRLCRRQRTFWHRMGRCRKLPCFWRLLRAGATG